MSDDLYNDDIDAMWEQKYFNFFTDVSLDREESRNVVSLENSMDSATESENCENLVFYIGPWGIPINGKPLLTVFHKLDGGRVLKPWVNILQSVADLYRKELTVVVTDEQHISLLDPQYVCYIKQFNKADPPIIYGVDSKGRKFKYTGAITIQSLMEYCQNLLDGKLYISEPLPLNRRDSILKICVADNFKELVEQNKNDVLLVFYTDWCIYSQELMPVLDEVSEILNSDTICIAKFNAEKNYIPLEYNIFCYPMIYLISRDNKRTRIEYEVGPRTLENVLKFIAANTYDELLYYDRLGQYKY